jgi:Aspartyl/Asparaginyl beta-hydroxylase
VAALKYEAPRTRFAMSNVATIVKSAILKTKVGVHRPSPSLFFYPGLNSRPVYDWDSARPNDNEVTTRILSSYGDTLRRNLPTILEEYAKIRASTGGQSDYKLTADEHKLHDGNWDWNSYVLKGKRQSHFAVLCPKTVELLESVKSSGRLMTQTPFSFAFFSTLKGKSSINAHYGPCNLRLRCHFPLIVPEGDCGMEVGGRKIRWEVGKALFFDDCYEHRVWNNTDKERVVLLFDIWHPDLTEDEIDAIVDMFGYAKSQGWLKE